MIPWIQYLGAGAGDGMIDHQNWDQLEFSVCVSLRDLVPDGHVLARVDRVLDLGWLAEDIADFYSVGTGRLWVAPEAAVRIMRAGFLLGIVHDRRLMREAQVNLAIRWFAGYGLHERLPDHSSLTRIRRRWGAERFHRIFEPTVPSCVDAGIATNNSCTLMHRLSGPMSAGKDHSANED